MLQARRWPGERPLTVGPQGSRGAASAVSLSRMSGLNGSVGQRRSGLGRQAGNAQLRLVDDALAQLRQLAAALEQVDGALEVDAAGVELGQDLLQLTLGDLESR